VVGTRCSPRFPPSMPSIMVVIMASDSLHRITQTSHSRGLHTWGTHLAGTNEPASRCVTPVLARRLMSSILVCSGIDFFSFCNPSRGPTSTMRAWSAERGLDVLSLLTSWRLSGGARRAGTAFICVGSRLAEVGDEGRIRVSGRRHSPKGRLITRCYIIS